MVERNQVPIELIGGPEDGRTLTVPAGRAGLPTPCFEFPGEFRPDFDAATFLRAVRAGCAELTWLGYRRDSRRDDGVWRYRYTGSRTTRITDTPADGSA
ncbi:hypothetical protein LX15_002016 [Streptoalloteichus tenebrarius]|uniref:Uncharacterized protein n=1 Tax=Streptoalloteichus tenebrarius (strain ATCC 17920 / DSM 40477 / JCM 4838 / CBS 697.72 / NBRC 16177 / NCIMB 11028 / NRRL B-12390 / A12253. 1 / ISP 5477) TaxID=1933 RepID=A0ABT1HS52_STRSD|nr:hypothetical protein [Streptoalloteichus tenebrarius]MCP2258322.1 hypothetical protein [Streptoalloteichus tenebrarius]BFF03487.1 hypothetical protein GCM10020241_51620 [Streptoalloteichus tenebrarius]